MAISASFIWRTAVAEEEYLQKLDLRARQYISLPENQDKEVLIIIKTTKPVKWSYKRRFKKVGFHYRSVIKNIVTGSITCDRLDDLARLGFVERIEMAVPMEGKKDDKRIGG